MMNTNKKLARFEAKFHEVAAPVLATYSSPYSSHHGPPPWTLASDLIVRMEGLAAALRHAAVTVSSRDAFELTCLFKEAVVSLGDRVRWSVQPAMYFSVLDICGFPPNRPPRDFIY
jgi:hypothetical protein